MKKRQSILVIAALTIFALAAAGCSKTATNANNSNSSSDTKTTNSTTTNTTTATTPPITTPSSPTDVLLGAFDASKKKDVAGFKKALSPVDLEELGKMLGKNGKTVDDFLNLMMSSPENTMPDTLETRNEKIDGDRASVEYKGKDGQWKTAHFAKEGGGWKWKLGGPETKESGSAKDSGEKNDDNHDMKSK